MTASNAALVFQEARGGTYEVSGIELDAGDTETRRRQKCLAELSSQRDSKQLKTKALTSEMDKRLDKISRA